jgi:hypothetical protein
MNLLNRGTRYNYRSTNSGKTLKTMLSSAGILPTVNVALIELPRLFSRLDNVNTVDKVK